MATIDSIGARQQRRVFVNAAGQLTASGHQKPELLAERPTKSGPEHHQADGAEQVALLLSLRDPRHLQPRWWAGASRDAETATLFRSLFDDAIAKHKVPPGQMTMHADRGGPMKAKVAPAKAGGDRAAARRPRRHSLAHRPHTPTACRCEGGDNPFSKATSKP